MKNRLTLFKFYQNLLLKLEGQIIHFLHFSGQDMYSVKFGNILFSNKKHTLPPYKLNGRSLSKNYVNSNIVFFFKRDKSSSYIYKFQVIDKIWSLFKCVNKIHVLHFISNFHV